MVSRGVVGICLLSALPLLCLELRRGIPDLGIKDLILLCGRIFLLLALLTLIISVTTSWLNSFKKSSPVYLKEEEEENEKKQKLVRKKQQEVQGEKASRYRETVLKPQQEMKLRKMEERFYQMAGEAWKLGSGHKLGGGEDLGLENESQTSFGTPNREAARRRNLPESSAKLSPPSRQSTPKKIIILPEEPPETAEEIPGVMHQLLSFMNSLYEACANIDVSLRGLSPQVVTVALRCPSGNVPRRRFLKSCCSQVLYEWMMKIGYHPSLYSLSTSFPRRVLQVEESWSLQDIGITVDTVLLMEKKEQLLKK